MNASTAGVGALPDERSAPPSDDGPPARVLTADWRLRLFLDGLSRERRAAIAARPRFYSIPWIRRADEPDDDDLPF